MNDCAAYDRVKNFLDNIQNMSLLEIEKGLKKRENELYTLFKKLERMHAMDDRFQAVDLSEDIYGLVRLMNQKKTIKRFPLLSRAAGIF